ncbi:MAG: toll/interleukin-1 receptor domain-containing protein [Bacteroidota bacterium]
MPDSSPIFLSHASADDAFVAQLRQKLELHGLSVWTDDQQLRGGDSLKQEIKTAIEGARAFFVIVSPNTMKSIWVKREVNWAEQVRQNGKPDYQVVPILIEGGDLGMLPFLFEDDKLAIQISHTVNGPGRSFWGDSGGLGGRTSHANRTHPPDRSPAHHGAAPGIAPSHHAGRQRAPPGRSQIGLSTR